MNSGTFSFSHIFGLYVASLYYTAQKHRIHANVGQKSSRAFQHHLPAAALLAFFWETTYIAKSLWRDELYFAKFSLDYVIRFECLQKMIEWYIGSKNNWSVNTKTSGRAFKKFLSTEDWQELESTYTGSDIEENWQALFNVIQFFRRIAKEVAHKSGYKYLDELDSKVTAYCKNAKSISKD